MRKIFFWVPIILMVIASCSKKAAPTKEAAIDATDLFSKKCARCHGPNGIDGRAPNLSKIDYNKKEVIEIITNGHGHMPSFEDVLTQKEITAVADYVLAFKK